MSHDPAAHLKLDEILRLLHTVIRGEIYIMADLASLEAQVARNTIVT